MDQIGGEREGRRTTLREVIWASVVGTVIEWYDFFIYGAASAVVFPALFFPEFAARRDDGRLRYIRGGLLRPAP